MSLFNCPECQHQISTAADACPHCGYPVGGTKPAWEGPPCHACSGSATTRCQACGKLSCPEHVQSTLVELYNARRHELLCADCAKKEADEQANAEVISIIVMIVIFGLIFASAAASNSKPGRSPFHRHGVTDQAPALQIEV